MCGALACWCGRPTLTARNRTRWTFCFREKKEKNLYCFQHKKVQLSVGCICRVFAFFKSSYVPRFCELEWECGFFFFVPGNERKRRDADAWRWESYGFTSQLSTGDVRTHEGLLDIQVSCLNHQTIISWFNKWQWKTDSYCSVFQGRRKAWICHRGASAARVLLWYFSLVLRMMGVAGLCKNV